jgi:hypothetical protein
MDPTRTAQISMFSLFYMFSVLHSRQEFSNITSPRARGGGGFFKLPV